MFAKQTNPAFFISSRSSDTSIEYSICSADSSHKGLFAPQFCSWLFLCLLSVFPGEINLKTAQFFLLFICWFICLSYSLLFCGKQINRNAEQCCSRDRFKDGKVFPPHKSIKSWPQAQRNSSIFRLHQALKGVSLCQLVGCPRDIWSWIRTQFFI